MTEPSILAGLRYRFYRGAEAVSPLIILVHGRAGNINVMSTFNRCLPDGVARVFVEANQPDPIGGFSWWLVDDESAATGGPKAAVLIERFIEALIEAVNISPTALVALGFSQGAGVVSLCLQRSPDRFVGVGLLAGFVIPVGEPNRADHVRPARVFVAHGTQDATIPIGRAREGAELLQKLGFAVEWHEEEVGHKVGAAAMRSLKEWVARTLDG